MTKVKKCSFHPDTLKNTPAYSANALTALRQALKRFGAPNEEIAARIEDLKALLTVMKLAPLTEGYLIRNDPERGSAPNTNVEEAFCVRLDLPFFSSNMVSGAVEDYAVQFFNSKSATEVRLGLTSAMSLYCDYLPLLISVGTTKRSCALREIQTNVTTLWAHEKFDYHSVCEKLPEEIRGLWGLVGDATSFYILITNAQNGWAFCRDVLEIYEAAVRLDELSRHVFKNAKDSYTIIESYELANDKYALTVEVSKSASPVKSGVTLVNVFADTDEPDDDELRRLLGDS